MAWSLRPEYSITCSNNQWNPLENNQWNPFVTHSSAVRFTPLTESCWCTFSSERSHMNNIWTQLLQHDILSTSKLTRFSMFWAILVSAFEARDSDKEGLKRTSIIAWKFSELFKCCCFRTFKYTYLMLYLPTVHVLRWFKMILYTFYQHDYPIFYKFCHNLCN